MSTRKIALAGIVVLYAMGGCSTSQTRQLEAGDACVISRDVDGLVSDVDLAWAMDHAPGFLQARDAITANPNYLIVLHAIEETRVDRPGGQWVMTAYASPGNSDYGIVYVQFSSESCDVAYVEARSGTRVDFELKRGTGRLQSCSHPRYLRDPLRALEGVSREQHGATWHSPYRFMVWGGVGGGRCAALVRPDLDQSWWLEFRNLEFLEAVT